MAAEREFIPVLFKAPEPPKHVLLADVQKDKIYAYRTSGGNIMILCKIDSLYGFCRLDQTTGSTYNSLHIHLTIGDAINNGNTVFEFSNLTDFFRWANPRKVKRVEGKTISA